MPRIRLLTSIHGDGPVYGDAGTVLEVNSATARVWCDGQRAELVRDEKRQPATPPSK